MSGFLDTSIVVRYLTGDPPELAEQAARIIDGVDDLLITDVVLTETAYVLMSVYQVRREVTVDHLIAFLQKENISPFALDKSLVLHALLLCRPSGRVSFADAMVWAAARSASNKAVYSLDERFPDVGLEVRQTI
ncbi:MAG: PIN domain-containing protein [Dehalococcoidia bacterium]|nr:PIN domain-containing protein [Dehalococcoidia bacterium]